MGCPTQHRQLPSNFHLLIRVSKQASHCLLATSQFAMWYPLPTCMHVLHSETSMYICCHIGFPRLASLYISLFHLQMFFCLVRKGLALVTASKSVLASLPGSLFGEAGVGGEPACPGV